MALYESDYLSSQVDPVPGYLSFQASRNPVIEPVPGTIFEKLDSEFTIFKSILNKTIYNKLLNDPEARITVLAFPDREIPDQLRRNFMSLDAGDAHSIMSCHIIGDVRTSPQLTSASMLIPTKHSFIRLQTKKHSSSIHPFGTNSQQMINILSSGDMFKNGIVIVISEPIIP